MRYLLLVSHGEFAAGLKTSIAMFAQDKIGDVIANGLRDVMSTDEFEHHFRQSLSHLKEEDRVIVLADIIGGSPLTAACKVLDELGYLEDAIVLGGMNLPMAINAVVMKDMLDGQEFVKTVLGEAGAALRELDVVSSEDELDDDI